MGEEGVSPRQRLALAKQKIKVWEGKYKATYGCPPDREAMAQAPEDIRHAYKTYRYYRKAVTQPSTDKSSARDKELLHTSHDAGETILEKDKEATSTIHDERESSTNDKEVLRYSSSGDVSHHVSVSSTDDLVTSQDGNTHKEGSAGQEVLGVAGGDVCDLDMRLKNDVNGSVVSEIKTQSTNVSEAKTCNATVTTGNTSPTGGTGNTTPATKYANTSSGTWGTHLNKERNSTKKVNKDLSLYTKMAEKLRAKSTIKMRKSLSRVSRPQVNPFSSRLRVSNGSTETSNDSIDGCSNDSSLSKIKASDEETLQDISQVFASESNEVFDESSFGTVDELLPMSESEAMEDSSNKEFNPFREIREQSTSIFDALEAKSLEGLMGPNFVSKPKSVPSSIPDTMESDTFDKAPKYHEITSSQKAPVVQPISVLSTLGQTNTSGLLGIKKRASLNLAWVERYTEAPLEGSVAMEQTVPEENWKMKLIDKEWSEDAQERLQAEEPLVEEQFSDEDMFSMPKTAPKSTKPPKSSSVMNAMKPTRINVSAKNTTSKKPTKRALSNVNLNASKPTKTNAKVPAKTTKRKAPAVRKTMSKTAQKKEDSPLPTPNNTGRVLRTRSTRNTPKPDYAEDTDEEDYNIDTPTHGRQKRRMVDEDDDFDFEDGEQPEEDYITTPINGGQKRRIVEEEEEWQDSGDGAQPEEDYITTPINGGQKRRIVEEEEEYQDFGDEGQLEDQERTSPFAFEEEENIESEPAISEVCMRKRRKVETIEELEEQGKIQSQWPPPKKKRVARKKAPRGRPRKVNKENSPKIKPRKVDKENSPKIKRPVRKRKIIHPREEDDEDELEVEERGLAVDKPAQPSVPSTAYDETDDIESHGKKNTTTKGKYLTGKERLMKKAATGSLNNNFVRINLKKKVYVRGKKTMNGGKYKRQEWKKKQLMKSAEGGDPAAMKNLTCFKCGDFGHWARSCPGKRGDKLTPLEDYDEKESTFLSLEEAASMALGVKNKQSGPVISRLYPKAAETEKGDETTTPASDNNTEAGTGDTIAPELQEAAGDTEEEEIEAACNETQATSTSDTECLPDGENNTTNDPEQDNNSQQAASLAEYDFMDADDDDDMFGNLKEADFQEQEQPGPSSSQETITSTPQFVSSQSYTNPWEERPTVDPLYTLEEDGEVIATTEEVRDTLRMFGYPSFRAGQEDAIMRILSGQSTLLVLSTGSGKSLCYQLPAYLYAKHRSPCITLCVSPLVSLMEDQVLGLPSFLKAVCLHTHQSPTQRSQALMAIHSRAAHILLVSPEAVVASRTGGVLGTLLKELPPVAFACLDEAHCVSEWSHNFRPSYLRVCQVLRERLGVKTILGLTATARHATAHSIARHLLISDFDTGVIRGTSVPDNLQLSVSRDRNREEALVALLQGERFSSCSSIIIYCTRRDECERVSTLIRTQLLDPSKIDVKSNLKRHRGLSFDAEAYHAGLSSHRRHQVQKRFMSGKLRIVVATVAFGMGIDKSDVRGIIHFNMPRNVESYVQEIGRAGRDGEEAHCHLFLDDQDGRDIQELKRHIFANSIDRHTIRKLLNKIFKPCTCAKLKSLSSGSEEKEEEDLTIDIPSSPVHSYASKDTDARNSGTAADPFSVPTSSSCCPRHEVAIPIEAVVEELDLPEENLETLLCYLELHQGNLIHIQSHVYANCTVSCYGGPRQLVAVSRKCPPLAVAIALERQNGKDFTKSNSVSFPVVEVSSRMGWNSKIVKRELKALEWNTQGLSVGGNVKRSGAVVEMTDLSFHLEARGDLSDDERDRVLDAVYRRTKVQELDQLRQLHYTYQLLRSVSHSTILFCCDSVDQERCDRLRTELREYFRSDGALSEVEVEDKGGVKPEVECGIRGSVRSFLSTYSDQQWTGRAVARVFHGIGSPNYPTEVWGRVRRFWRQHLNADFNALVNIATQEILRCK